MFGVILETTDRQNYNLITNVISDKAHHAKHSAKVLHAKVDRYYTSCCHNYNQMIVFSEHFSETAAQYKKEVFQAKVVSPAAQEVNFMLPLSYLKCIVYCVISETVHHTHYNKEFLHAKVASPTPQVVHRVLPLSH